MKLLYTYKLFIQISNEQLDKVGKCGKVRYDLHIDPCGRRFEFVNFFPMYQKLFIESLERVFFFFKF